MSDFTQDNEALFAAARAACPAAIWSRAVELVRKSAVSGQTQEDSELICHVKSPTRSVPHTVQLYPQDAEWACDCDSRAACCEHVAAAVIALKQANAQGHALPQGGSHEARLVHRLSRHRGELSLSRVLVRADGSEQALETSLATAVATQSAGVTLSPSQQDLNVDRALGQRVSGPLPPDLAVGVIKLLAGARNVEFEGQTIVVSTEQLVPHAQVTDAQLADKRRGFNVELKPDPALLEVVASGIGRSAAGLHLLTELHSSGARWEKLPSSKFYPSDAVGTLVTEVLPELLKRFKVDVQTKKLPELTREAKPRAIVQVQQDGERLGALLTLVYGDPPLARIDAGRLIHLGGAVPIRDEALEQRVATRARDELGLNVGGRVWLSGQPAIALAEKLERWNGQIEGPRGKQLLFHSPLAPEMTRRFGQLELHFTSDAEGEALRADPTQVLRAWREHDAWVPLLSGGWAPLPASWLDKHGALLEQVLDGLAARGGLPTAAEGASALNGSLDPKAAQSLPALAELCELLDFPTPPELEPFRALLRGTDALPEVSLPADLTATLRSYQQQGVRWLNLLQKAGLGAVLADDMGLGKTLQTLCNLQGRCLVVCPTSVVHNWAQELARFRPGLDFHVYQGKGRSLKADVSVTITSYALLRLDQDVLAGVQWDQVVLDEAQHIKNPESQVTRAAYRLRSRFKLALSGTPIENRLSELWSLFHFTNRGLLGGRPDFQARYELPIQNGDARASGALRQRIAPFILRRHKSSVAKELPPRTDLFIHCTLDPQERAVYDAIFQATQRDVVAELRKGGGVMQALEALLRLRQAACHAALVPGVQLPNASALAAANGEVDEASLERDENDATTPEAAAPSFTSSKVRALVEALEQVVAEGHRALVFSQWTSLLDKVEPALDRARLSRGRLDGSTRDREGVVRDFQSDTGPNVLLLSLKAGGTGLNLTAADHVFMLDPWWNPAVEQQAADRAHRIGQQRPVFVHRLITTGTVEEKIVRLQAQKRELAEAALEGTEATASLGREELLELLS